MATARKELRILTILTLALFRQAVVAADVGEEIPISLEEIGVMLGCPDADLNVSDDSEEAQQKSNGRIISAYRLTGDARSFPPLSIFIGKERAFLTPELQEQVKEYMEKTEGNPFASSMIRSVKLGGDNHGIAMFAFGPGGVIKRLIATLPSIDRDVVTD